MLDVVVEESVNGDGDGHGDGDVEVMLIPSLYKFVYV